MKLTKSKLKEVIREVLEEETINEVNFDKIPTIPDIEVTSPGIRKLLEKIDPHKARVTVKLDFRQLFSKI